MSEQEKRAAVEAATEGLDKTQQAILMAYANGLKAGTEIAKACPSSVTGEHLISQAAPDSFPSRGSLNGEASA